MWLRFPHHPTADDDDWEDQPAQGWFYQWILGGVLPAVILGYGIYAMVSGQAAFDFDQLPLILYGTNAAAFGVAAISLGVFLHCHYFWGNVYDQAWLAVLGKIVGLVGFIAGLVVLIWRVGVWGWK